MKYILSLAMLFTSLEAMSDVYRKGILDFSNIGAGVYSLELKLNAKNQKIVGVPETRMRRGEDGNVCETRVNFNIGTAELKITDGSWAKYQTYPLIARIAYDRSSEVCDFSVLTWKGEYRITVEAINPVIELPVADLRTNAPVNALITPFNGFFSSKATIEINQGKQVVNPSEILDDHIISRFSPQANSVYYHIFTKTQTLGKGTLRLE